MTPLEQAARASLHAPSSCGAALHHARTALAAAGWGVAVDRLPDPDRPRLLARLRLGAPVPPDPEAQRMAAAIPRRRTDHRAFGERPVAEAELTKLRRFVEAEGAYLHVLRPDQVPELAVSAELAAGSELGDLPPLPPSPRRDPGDAITVTE